MKNESDVKRAMVKELKDCGCYARRVEDAFSVGFPDLIIIIPGLPVIFAEVKMVRSKSFGPTPRQFVELDRISISYGVRGIWMGWADGLLYATNHVGKSAQNPTVHISDCIKQHDEEKLMDFMVRFIKGDKANER